MMLGQKKTFWLSVVAALALVVQPQLLMAGSEIVAQPSASQRAQLPRDIVLGEGGLLTGQLIDEQGQAMALAPLSIQTADKEVARITTDNAGSFQVRNLQGGVYTIEAAGHQGVYRLWAPQTAPPIAQQQLTLVSQQEVIRGQYGRSPGGPLAKVGQFVAEHPIFTAAAVATAIAVPLAVSDDDDPPATP